MEVNELNDELRKLDVGTWSMKNRWIQLQSAFIHKHDGINNHQPISHTTSTFLWITRDWQVPQACWEQVPCVRGGTCLQHRNTRKQGTSKWIGLEKVTRTQFFSSEKQEKNTVWGGKNLRAQKTHQNLESWEASDSIHLFWSDFFKDETAWRWSASILSPGGSSSCWQFVHGFLCESSALSLLPHFGSTCAWRVNEGW